MPEPKPSKPRVLLQLDIDPHPSVFDAMVAIDSGVDHLLQYGGVRSWAVREPVHGLLFTRGGDDLKRSAIFVGGSDFGQAAAVFQAVQHVFFDPLRVSVVLDANGANTTAAAAVLAVERSLNRPENWDEIAVAILGAGPVGCQIALLMAKLGAQIRLGSPDLAQSQLAASTIPTKRQDLPVEPFEIQGDWQRSIAASTVLVAAGPAGVEILPAVGRDRFPDLRVAVDLNAVPPYGLGETKPTDADHDRAGVRVWGALGVGGLKMKIHKAVIRALFDGEPTVYDVDQVFAVARRLDAAPS